MLRARMRIFVAVALLCASQRVDVLRSLAPFAQGFTWPVFKWAGGADDKYFAKIGKNAISIYEARVLSTHTRACVSDAALQQVSWSVCPLPCVRFVQR